MPPLGSFEPVALQSLQYGQLAIGEQSAGDVFGLITGISCAVDMRRTTFLTGEKGDSGRQGEGE
jgi:hypothetical protein